MGEQFLEFGSSGGRIKVESMCDEREHLIDYVYDECDPRERQRVETHLSTCGDCLEEIQGLRQARHDLLAWDVPEHGSVWRPFAPPRQRASVRDIPAWAMAAAAGIIFMAGAAGGVATRMLMPVANVPVPVVQAAPLPVITALPAATLTDADIAKIEARILDRVRVQMGPAVVATSAQGQASTADIVSIRKELDALDDWHQQQVQLNVNLKQELLGLSKTTTNLKTGIELAAYRPSMSNSPVIPVR
jgi:hypothetical protein